MAYYNVQLITINNIWKIPPDNSKVLGFLNGNQNF